MKIVKLAEVPKFTKRCTCEECGTVVDVEEGDLRITTVQGPFNRFNGTYPRETKVAFDCPHCGKRVFPIEPGDAEFDKLLKRLKAAKKKGRDGKTAGTIPTPEEDDEGSSEDDSFEGSLR